MNSIRIFLLFSIVIYSILAFGGHAHSHSNEPPHLKYTKEINEAAQKEDDEHSHSHSHGHSHGHGHSHHQGCGHSHGHEDEFDEEEEEHGHSHVHSHGPKPQRMASTLPKIPTATYTEQPYSEDGWLSFLNNPQIRLWTYAIGSTLIISAFPCLLLAFIPVNSNANGESPLLRTLLAFGAGGLLGDAFLHLIPHASPGGHSHSHSHSHQSGHGHEPHDLKVGTWVLVGFMVFFIVEKVVRIIRGEDHQHAGHGHSHSNVKKTTKQKTKEKDSDGENEEEKEKTKQGKKQITHEDGGRVRVAAYLNLIADFMHNFTDGLAIGASFIAGTTIGIVTMVTVLVHEVPHEIGDFAILVQSGFSKKRAMLIQLCTALGALAGCTLSLWDVDAAALAEAAEQSWAIPFTAGGFIYIGTVSMIPDLLEGSTAWQSVKEILAILLGLFMMYLIAFFE